MNRLSFKDCLGLNTVDRKCYVTAGETNPATGKAYAVRPDGIWDDNYFAQNFANNAATNYGHPGSSASFEQLAQQQLDFQRKANEPAIQSYEQSIPETQQKFAAEKTRLSGEKEPLKQRYQNIINQLKGRESQDLGAAQTRTGREFGYRGIPASSTLYLDELNRSESPIRERYGTQITDVGLQQEDQLRGIDSLISQLTGQETDSVRAIRNAMAQLQSGGAQSGIQNALVMLQNQQQAQQFQQQQALASKEFDLKKWVAENPAAEDLSKNYLKVAEGESVFDLSSLQSIFSKAKTYKGTDDGGNNRGGI